MNDYTEFDGMSLPELAKVFNELKEKLDEVTELKTALQKKYDHIRLNKIPEAMDEEGVNTVTYADIGRISLTSDIYASIPSDKKEESYEWLRENNHGGIIVDYVHPGTLKATLKSIIKKGETLPEELFTVTPFSRASITKVK